jgi:membrane protease subunit (stomatin/prohibitin family)
MSADEIDREWNDMFWGTSMPVSVMIGSDFAQVQARGKLSFVVTDPGRLEAQVTDADQVTGLVKSILVSALTDIIGEQSSQLSDIEQLTASAPQILQALQAKLELKFKEVGLQFKALSIEAIENR